MPSEKTKYSLQVVIILGVFFFVLFNLIFKLVIDMRAESLREKAEQLEKDRLKQAFVAGMDDKYNRLVKLFDSGEYEKALGIIKEFNTHGNSGFKDLAKIKKEIRLVLLKKKLEFIPRIHLNEYKKLSEEIDIEEDKATEVFIRTPRYGQYFYPSEFPIVFEGVALSVSGDFSDGLVWSSSIDGLLGTGKKIAVPLSIGEHQITATGTNGTTQGSMTTRVYIEKEPDFIKKSTD